MESFDREQNVRPRFVPSVLDGRQITLSNTNPARKIRLFATNPQMLMRSARRMPAELKDVVLIIDDSSRPEPLN